MTNPLEDIEDVHALMGMGKMGFHVLKGALQEGATPQEAKDVTTSYFTGMFKASKDNPEEENEQTPPS